MKNYLYRLFFLVWLILVGTNGVMAATVPLAHTQLEAQAEVSYIPSGAQEYARQLSNYVYLQVLPVAALQLNAADAVSADRGQRVTIPAQLRNTGNTPSHYRFSFQFGHFSFLHDLKLYQDVNGNGRLDSDDRLLAATGAAESSGDELELQPGEVAMLLISGAPDRSAGAKEILQFAVETIDGDAADTKNISLLFDDGAAINLSHGASTLLVQQGRDITFRTALQNVGSANLGVADGIDGSDIRIDGNQAKVILMRSLVPANMEYVPDSLFTVNHGAKVLVRAKGDPQWSYRTNSANLAAYSIAEVAVALESELAAQSSLFMNFKLRLAADESGRAIQSIDDLAEGFYSDGISTAARRVESNILSLKVDGANGPDLVPHLTHVGNYTHGHNVTYSAALSNAGAVPTQGEMHMSFQFPRTVDVLSVQSSGWTCDAAARTMTCRNAQSVEVGASSPTVHVVARLAGSPEPITPGTSVDVVVEADGGGESYQAKGNNRVVDHAVVTKNHSLSGHVWLDAQGQRRLSGGSVLLKGWRAQLLQVASGGDTAKIVAEAATDASGYYEIDDITPGRAYALRFVSPDGRLLGTPQDGEHGTPVSGHKGDRRHGWLFYSSFDRSYTEQSLSLRPSGIVYNSLTRQPVAGAKVTLRSTHGGLVPERDVLGGSTTATTNANGFYFLSLTPDAAVDTYSLDVEAEGYVTGLSSKLPAQADAFTPAADGMPSPVTEGLSIPAGGEAPTYYSHFLAGGATDRIINNHLAIDPLVASSAAALSLKKRVNKKTVELVDVVTYSLSLSHKQQLPLSGFQLTDDLPAGFTYIQGSSRLSINGLLATPVDDPQIAGKRLTYVINSPLPPDVPADLTYHVAVGATAHIGTKATNRAQATSGMLVSNVATASVNVVGGIFSDDAFVAGKVFMNCSGNGKQDANSPGVPGVRIYLEDGTYAETDIDGKYSLYGLKPVTHALKIDSSTLPAGTHAVPLDHRNLSGSGRFLDVRNGELARGDFALSCSDGGRAEILVRRARLSETSELNTALHDKLPAEYVRNDETSVKMRPASGLVKGAVPGNLPAKDEMVGSQPLSVASQALGEAAREMAVPSIDALLRQTSTELDFVNLHAGQIMSGMQTSVQVKGHSGATFALAVNGAPVPLNQVGRRSELAVRSVAAWEYIGVNLQPGKNTLSLQEMVQGKVAHEKTIMIVAPGKLARIVLHVPDSPVADPAVPLPVRIELQDKEGVPIGARSPLTLSTSRGTWQATDLDPAQEGTQVFIEGGQATFPLLPPEQAGELTLSVSSGTVEVQRKVNLQPKLRSMLATGILEGVISLRNRTIERTDAGNNGFERELRGLNRSWDGGKSNIGSRAAFFLKGKVKGEYLLTAAFDSDKEARERLFRDIEPDRYYPIYGDSSVRGFEAQSTSRLYLRVDRGNSYLLYGDFTTSDGDDARQLTQYDRGVTGIRQHYEKAGVKANFFVSRDNLVQRIREIRANGTSLFPDVFGADYVVNSERVEIITRQRDQHGLIVGQPLVLTPFADYSVDEFGNLRLKANIPSINPDTGNPNFIRITYESDGNGPAFWLYGVDGKIRVLEGLTVGGVVVKDSNPADPRSLYGATVEASLGEHNHIVGEYGRTETLKKGVGNGSRIDFKHDGEQVQAHVSVLKTDDGFDNTSSAVSSGKTEYRAKASVTLDPDNALKVEAIHTNSDDSQVDLTQSDRGAVAGSTGVSLTGAQVMWQHRLSDHFSMEAGSRVAKGSIQSGAHAEDVNNITARGRLTATIPGLPAASVYGEYEADVRDTAKRAIGIGGDYQMQDHSRLYVRRELLSSLGSMYEFNTSQRTFRTLAGIERPFSKSGKIFSEYRQGGTIDGRDAQAAYGLRNGWEVQPGLLLHANFERTDSRGTGASGSNNGSTALSGAVEYLANSRWKGSASVELRQATLEDSTLISAGVAVKLNSDWSFLGKTAWYQTRGRAGNTHSDSLRTRLRLGLAYRPVDSNALNALSYYERRLEKGRMTTQDDDAGVRTVDLVSAHVNWQPWRRWTMSGRYAGKLVTEQSFGRHDRVSGNLLSARVTRDIGRRWDIGASGSLMIDNQGQQQYALGMEVGYMLGDDLWLSLGYNNVGFEDREFGRMAQTSQGAYVRMRYRFDENS